jgi:DNA-binding CsgD family transcriptional regulator
LKDISRLPIVIEHKSLWLADRAAVEATKEVAKHNGVSLDKLEEHHRARLLEKIGQIITEDRLTGISRCEDHVERQLMLRTLIEEVAAAIRGAFSASENLRSGRPIKHEARDAKISIMRSRGMTYGQIATQLRMTRHAVQAAIRRQTSKRRQIYLYYAVVKKLLEPLGVTFRESESALTNSPM